jgi:hypothetical protein
MPEGEQLIERLEEGDCDGSRIEKRGIMDATSTR